MASLSWYGHTTLSLLAVLTIQGLDAYKLLLSAANMRRTRTAAQRANPQVRESKLKADTAKGPLCLSINSDLPALFNVNWIAGYFWGCVLIAGE
jgi:hypothetical protein